MQALELERSIERLPATGFIRQAALLGTRDAPGPLPVSHATLWRMVRSGAFPAPVKLTPKVTAWRLEDVRQWMVEAVK